MTHLSSRFISREAFRVPADLLRHADQHVHFVHGQVDSPENPTQGKFQMIGILLSGDSSCNVVATLFSRRNLAWRTS